MMGWPGARPGNEPCTEPVLVRARSSDGVQTVAVAELSAAFSQSGTAWRIKTWLAKQTPGGGRTGVPPLGSMRSTEICAVKGPALPATAPTERAMWFNGVVRVADHPPVNGAAGLNAGTEPLAAAW